MKKSTKEKASSTGAILPAIKQSKFAKALVNTGRTHGNHIEAAEIYSVDWKALSRDKYAPWGRGSASGLA